MCWHVTLQLNVAVQTHNKPVMGQHRNKRRRREMARKWQKHDSNGGAVVCAMPGGRRYAGAGAIHRCGVCVEWRAGRTRTRTARDANKPDPYGRGQCY